MPMMQSTDKVIRAFLDGKPLKAGSAAMTDGKTLYSYGIPIAVTIDKGVKAVLTHPIASKTTATHIHAVAKETPIRVTPSEEEVKAMNKALIGHNARIYRVHL